MKSKPVSIVMSAICTAVFCFGGGGRHVGAGRDRGPRV